MYITLYDEFILFIEDLIELLKQDWIKTKKFFKENTKYTFWIIILFITMQFTDIITLGKSWEIYCKKNGIQMGGSGESATTTATATAAPSASTGAAASGATGAATGAAAGATGAAASGATGAAASGATGAAAGATGAAAGATGAAAGATGAAKPAAADGTGVVKKGKYAKTKSGLTDTIKNNPVFGHLDKIFGMVESMVMVIMFILVVVGILSLPIIILIAITYCVVKTVLKKFSIL